MWPVVIFFTSSVWLYVSSPRWGATSNPLRVTFPQIYCPKHICCCWLGDVETHYSHHKSCERLKGNRTSSLFSPCDAILDSFLSSQSLLPLFAGQQAPAGLWDASPLNYSSSAPPDGAQNLPLPLYCCIKHFFGDKQFRANSKIKNIHPEANEYSSLLECNPIIIWYFL